MTQSPPRPTVEIRGSEVRRRRTARGKGSREFAALTGITADYLKKLELGYRRRVSPALFLRIAEALGMDEQSRAELIQDDAA